MPAAFEIGKVAPHATRNFYMSRGAHVAIWQACCSIFSSIWRLRMFLFCLPWQILIAATSQPESVAHLELVIRIGVKVIPSDADPAQADPAHMGRGL